MNNPVDFILLICTNLPMGGYHIFEQADSLEGEVVVVIDKVQLQHVPVHLALLLEAGLQALVPGPAHDEDHAAVAPLRVGAAAPRCPHALGPNSIEQSLELFLRVCTVK